MKRTTLAGCPSVGSGPPGTAANPATPPSRLTLGRPFPAKGPRRPCPLPGGSTWCRTATPPSPTRPRWALPAVAILDLLQYLERAQPPASVAREISCNERLQLVVRGGLTTTLRLRLPFGQSSELPAARTRIGDANDDFSIRADCHGLPAGPVVACPRPYPPPYQPLSQESSDPRVVGGAQGIDQQTG